MVYAMEVQKGQIRDKLGEAKYEEIYRFLVYHRSQSTADENMIYEELKYKVGGDRYLLTEVFKLDGIVFREILQAGVMDQ